MIERAGVAKASLYSTFGSKDELVRAYLAERAERAARRGSRHASSKETAPRAKLLAIFDELGELVDDRTSAAVPSSMRAPRARAKLGHARLHFQRAWLRDLMMMLAREMGAEEPTFLASQLHLVYDGALVAASLDRIFRCGACARGRGDPDRRAAPRKSTQFRTDGQRRRAADTP